MPPHRLLLAARISARKRGRRRGSDLFRASLASQLRDLVQNVDRLPPLFPHPREHVGSAHPAFGLAGIREKMIQFPSIDAACVGLSAKGSNGRAEMLERQEEIL